MLQPLAEMQESLDALTAFKRTQHAILHADVGRGHTLDAGDVSRIREHQVRGAAAAALSGLAARWLGRNGPGGHSFDGGAFSGSGRAASAWDAPAIVYLRDVRHAVVDRLKAEGLGGELAHSKCCTRKYASVTGSV